MRPRLYTPGPTQIPDEVINVMSQPMRHHRSADFKKLFKETSRNLNQLFKTEDDVLTLTCSGTGAMESAIVNILSAGEKVLSIEGGKFGERWGDVSRTFGLNVVSVEVPWGKTLDLDDFKAKLLEHSDARAVIVTHSETSTGVAFDVQTITELTHQHSDAVVIVDGITSVGVLPFYKDEWGVDVVVSGSQKGAMVPSGLAFVALNEKAWRLAEKSNLPKFYFDLPKARKALDNDTTPFTPAVTMILGLHTSLNMMLERGVEHFWSKYARLAHSTREGAKAVGLELFAETPSNALTAIKIPENIDGVAFVNCLREKYNITVAGGQAQLKGNIFRVAHMGYYDHLDMVAFASAMELALKDHGWEFELGRAVATVQIAYSNDLELSLAK